MKLKFSNQRDFYLKIKTINNFSILRTLFYFISFFFQNWQNHLLISIFKIIIQFPDCFCRYKKLWAKHQKSLRGLPNWKLALAFKERPFLLSSNSNSTTSSSPRSLSECFSPEKEDTNRETVSELAVIWYNFPFCHFFLSFLQIKNKKRFSATLSASTAWRDFWWISD